MEDYCIVYAHSFIEDGEGNQYAATQVLWAKNKRIVATKIEEVMADDEDDDAVVVQATIRAFVGSNVGKDAEHIQTPLLSIHDLRFIINMSNEERERWCIKIGDVKYINCPAHPSLEKIKEIVQHCELHAKEELAFF